MKRIPERDWRKLREIREGARNRLCARILEDLKAKIEEADLEEGAYKAYLAVYEDVKKHDKKVARLFDDWGRGSAYFSLAAWTKAGIVTEEEFEAFSDDTKECVRALSDLWS